MALQPAPSAQRGVEIVRFLADHPGEVFAVADLARRLGQSRATCQAVLLALEPPNWVRRTESGYTLGAGLIPIGAAAQRGAAVVGLLRAATRRLYQETGCEVIGYLPAGDQLVNVGRVGPPFLLSATMMEGQAFPLAPPNGLAFAAWDDAELDRWIARAPGIGREGETRLREAAASVRTLGYGIVLDSFTRRDLESGLADLPEERRRPMEQALAQDELVRVARVESRTVRHSFVSAPVFGADGRVAALMGVIFETDHDAEVPDIAAALLAASRQLSDGLGAPSPERGGEGPS
ncbi:helix-turn-helix domain-containing protein [Actinomadura rugatobispora]|uniref:Helix-turn-helix domain-containing protein n=1 Tax=Actinomadura rugatobispora TaxID=1994 RepID=A0ABW1A5D7_9ACTN|nr:hypothetical protein GCM10010200_018460 [Actinomadura rugatobispora]